MAEETPAVTTDTAGINRTLGGDITTDPATTTSPPSTTQETKKPEDTSLLNRTEEPKKEEPKVEEKKPEDKKAETKAPEKYEDFKLPEGWKLDDEIGKEVTGIFKDLGLPQEGAQRLVDFYVKQAQEAFEAPFKAWQDMRKDWRDAALAHTDLAGKLGPGKEITVRMGRILDAHPDQGLVRDFRDLMDTTGAGDNPAFIRMFDYLAKQLSEGTHVSGNGPSKAGQSKPGEAPPTAAGALWPNLPSASERR